MASRVRPDLGVEITTSARGIGVDATRLSAAAARMQAAHVELAAAWADFPAGARARIGTVRQTLHPDGTSSTDMERPAAPTDPGPDFRRG